MESSDHQNSTKIILQSDIFGRRILKMPESMKNKLIMSLKLLENI